MTFDSHQDTRDRTIALEERFRNLEKRFESIDTKVTEMHTLLTQAKGVRLIIVGAISLATFLLSVAAYFKFK